MASIDRERWLALGPYLERAMELEGEALTSWLEGLRAEQPDVARDLESLLADRDAMDRERFLEADEPWLAWASPTPEQVGPYRLIRQLGEGGMGLVYLAEATGPIRREVALKLIRPGLDSEKILARFSAERQILANLNHVGVSKVYDAGVSADGRPYVVMEYVAGRSLKIFCDEERLTIRERLGLVLQVCAAIQHAHQKGVIHRDIKPSNILVSVIDGKPVVKVIDFGVAKALEPQPDDALLTQTGAAPGTPEYMSPEQAMQGMESVDTRSDVYALGVVLYELLAGARPFDAPPAFRGATHALPDAAWDRDPPKLASRALESKMNPAELAARRGTDPRRLARELEGELDWIVRKALERQPARRYTAAAELAADIERHLRGEPVLAGPPTTLYRLGKLARRHRMTAAALAAIAVTILAGGVVSSFALLRAKRAEGAAREDLRASLISQAAMLTGSSELDRRSRALAALEQAASIRPGLDARNAAIASLTTPGFRAVRQFNPYESDAIVAWPDAALRRYARAHADGSITIHAIDGGAELIRLPPVRVPADIGLFSPDGRWLAVDYHDEQLRLWDLTNRTQRLLLDHVGAFRFTPDSRRLVARSEKRAHLFDLAGGSGRSWPDPGPFTDAWPATHPSEPVLFTTSLGNREIRIRDSRSGAEQRRIPVPALGRAASWSADGASVITTHEDFSIRVWDWPAMDMPRLILRFHEAEPSHVACDPSGRWLATSGWDNKIGVFDLRDGRLVLSERGSVVNSAWDRPAFLMENGQQWSLIELQPSFALESTAWPETYKGPQDIAWSPDGRWLASAGPGGVSVLDRSSGLIARVLREEHAIRVAFRSDSRALRAITTDDIHEWAVESDPAAGTLRFEPREVPGRSSRPSVFRAVGGLSDDGERWVSQAVDPLTNAPAWRCGRFDSSRVETMDGLAREDNGPVFSHDGRWLAWGNWHGTNAAAERIGGDERPAVFPAGGIASVAFSPDDRRLVVGGPQAVRFYDVGSWKESATMARRPVSDLTPHFDFSHDSAICAAVLPPDRLALIDAATGRELASIPASPYLFARPAFSPDDRYLAVASVDHHVLIWDVSQLRGELRRLGLDWVNPADGARP